MYAQNNNLISNIKQHWRSHRCIVDLSAIYHYQVGRSP